MCEEVEEVYKVWTWKNLRTLSVAVYFDVFPWQWYVRRESEVGVYEARWVFQFGPIAVAAIVDIGTCSTGDWRARFGLSQYEAWGRAKPERVSE